MEIRIEDESVTLEMTRSEAVRLGIAIDAGCETVSRAEYFIRTGLAEPDLQKIADILTRSDASEPAQFAVPLEPGVEEIENPRRPRPPS